MTFHIAGAIGALLAASAVVAEPFGGMRSLLAKSQCPAGGDDKVCTKALDDGKCFNDPANWIISGGNGSPYTITLKNCLFQQGKAVSFISYGGVNDDGSCKPCSGKQESVAFGATIDGVKLTVPANECAGKPTDGICLFVHDGQLKQPTQRPGIPAGCTSSDNQLCALCPIKVIPNLPSPTPCDDKIPCTTGDQCDGSGKCVGTPTASKCDDSIGCTVDKCEPGAQADDDGCTHTPTNSKCNDEIGCTVDTCEPKNPKADTSSGCVFTPDNTMCNDSVGCTVDTCDATKGCQYKPDDSKCNDSVGCTVDTCDAIKDCQHTPDDSKCNDSVGCTVDTCDATKGCQYAPDDTKCNDNVPCTVDTCDATKGCQYAPDDTKCDDKVPCTVDTCTATGCNFAEDDEKCNTPGVCEILEGAMCTDTGCDYQPKTCDDPPACKVAAGATCNTDGCSYPDKNCDDKKSCTVDSCDEATNKCVNRVACNAPPKCKSADGAECTATGCIYPNPQDCDDHKPCTTDTCNPITGECVFTSNCPAPQDKCKKAECTTEGCVELPDASQNGKSCTSSDSGCASSTCDNGVCKCNCKAVGGTCKTGADCCGALQCGKGGKCVDVCTNYVGTCGQCPIDANGLCVSGNQAGKSNCGNACQKLCTAVCGPGSYSNGQCSNVGGDGDACKALANFSSGPCCKCDAC